MRQRKVFISADHELTCLAYEEALKRGLDSEYGTGQDGYWVQVFDCSLLEFTAILLAAQHDQEEIHMRQPRSSGLGASAFGPDTFGLTADTTAGETP